MNNIGGILALFEKIIESEVGSKKIIQEVLFDIIGVKIDSSKIKVKEFSLYIEGHPALKNELFLKQDLLKTEINKRIGKSFDSFN